MQLTETISQYIENQFPAIYREEGELLVAFVTAYYEYLEETGLINRKMFKIKDIDETFDEFVEFFRKKYLDSFPFISATDDRFLIKNIIDYYKSKGSEQSLKLLMKLLFNEEVDVYYPRLDVLRPSDSRWVVPYYLELTFSPRTRRFLGKEVTGSNSGAKGFVEGIVSKRINGRIIDLLYLSNIRGNFVLGDLITDDGNLFKSPKMIGSLTSVSDIDTNEAGYAVGQRLRVISQNGVGALARISRIFSSSDRVNIQLLDGGYGYTLDDDTRIYTSKDVLFCDNENFEFSDFEIVTQKLEKINAPSIELEIGDEVIGYDIGDVEIARGRVVSIEQDFITVEIDEGSLKPRYTLGLDQENRFFISDILEVEKEYTLDIENIVGVFLEGEEILQREIVSGISTKIASGIVDSVIGDTLNIIIAFGRFEEGLTITGKTSGTTATISSSELTSNDIRLSVIEAEEFANTIVVELYSTPSFDEESTDEENGEAITVADLENKAIKDLSSNKRNLVIESFDSENYVIINSLEETITSYNDVSAVGILIGQREDNIGISRNKYPFIYVDDTPNYITSSITNVSKEITRIGSGSGAGFDIASLENEETIDLGSEIINSDNIIGTSFLDVALGGANTAAGTIEMNSGIGRVTECIVFDGGSGYANSSTVTFVGGGKNDSDPLFSASATVTTDGSGEIVSITVTDPGEGYLEVPDIVISDGSGANVAVIMEYGFGFQKLPYSNLGTVINDALEKKQTIIGTISSITNISRGVGYDVNPYLKVLNPFISSYNINNAWLTRGLQIGGTFALNEIVEASNGAKGQIIGFDQNRLLVKKLSFQNRFSAPDTLTGTLTGATADLLEVDIQPSRVMGDNAEFRTFVNLADGIIAEVEIISSGYGYVDNERVDLLDDNNVLAAFGLGSILNQGKSLGYWETTTSHLNDKKLHDNYFYQEYSYQIESSLSFERYEVIVRNLLHVAGMELFGKIGINTRIETDKEVFTSISTGSPVFTTTDMIGDQNIVGVQYEEINVDATESGVGRISTDVVIIDGGFGYSNTSVLEFIGGGIDANTQPTEVAEASIVTDEFGTITEFIITNQGEGYWSLPEVSIEDGNGAIIEISVDYGYGFPKLPYSNLDTNINDAISQGEILFNEEEVLF
jgi:hypothetical protein